MSILSAPKRPVLRYHGGKWRLAPWIIEHFPEHRVYVEPYGGGASVLVRKKRSYAEVYNDLDSEIVNLFRVLRNRDDAARLTELVRLTPFAREEFVESYIPCEDPIEQARRTVARASLGFGSASASKQATGFRANSNRSGTSPVHDWANLPSNFQAIVDRLQGVCIENRDAKEVIAQHDSPQTLHYVDPPYTHNSRTTSGIGAYKHEMTDDDHRELHQVLCNVQGYVVLSGYPSELYDELYGDWVCFKKDAHADKARDRVECLWLSQRTAKALNRLDFGDV